MSFTSILRTPLRYLNDHYSGKGQKKVFADKKHAPVIREPFEKVTAGSTSRAIHNWMKEIDFRTKNGELMTLSGVYRMLNSITPTNTGSSSSRRAQLLSKSLR